MSKVKGPFYGLMSLVVALAVFNLPTVELRGSCKSSLSDSSEVSHQDRQPRPIKLGVSGSNIKDPCIAGTLGSLVRDFEGNRYILSNTHVYAAPPDAMIGDPIIQPSRGDIFCLEILADEVAHLSAWVPLVPFGLGTVDAAIAKVVHKKVNNRGSILEIGPITQEPKEAIVGLRVKKSGRTTGLTRGVIMATNVTIVIAYRTFLSEYRGQILIEGNGFALPGDSGSLLVEDVSKYPQPIGLVFAGDASVGVSFANPIQEVLNALHVKMVGVEKSRHRDRHSARREKEADSSIVPEEVMASRISQARKTQEQYGEQLMQIEGVVGHGIGLSKTDNTVLALLVLVEEAGEGILQQLPTTLDGMPVEVMVVGKQQAL